MCTTRSISLIAELNADNLINEFITEIFQIINLETSPSVTNCLLEIMQQLIDECPYLPMQSVVVLLSQFEKKNQQFNPAAFKFACGTTLSDLYV